LRRDLMKSLATALAAALALAVIGVLAFMYGDKDDSPGLSLIGVLLVVGGLVIGVRATLRRARR
jgi:peptidoglycan/LPS O-acetylase OafA/YrhL